MARARMIKPDFFDDEKIATLSHSARLVYIGMWIICDDYGVCKAHPVWLRNRIFPFEDISPEEFQRWLEELEKAKRVISFDAEGERYYYLPKFKKHQIINRPSKWRYPEPPAKLLEEQIYPSPPKPKKVIPNKNNGLPFSDDAFSCLLFFKVKREKAEQLIQKYPLDFIQEKCRHYSWIKKYRPDLISKNPTGYLIRSIEENYPPPAGYEEWIESEFKRRRNGGEEDPEDIRRKIRQSLQGA